MNVGVNVGVSVASGVLVGAVVGVTVSVGVSSGVVMLSGVFSISSVAAAMFAARGISELSARGGDNCGSA